MIANYIMLTQKETAEMPREEFFNCKKTEYMVISKMKSLRYES